MRIFLTITCLIVSVLLNSAEAKNVHLKGELKNFGSEVLMTKGTPEASLLREGIVIKLDSLNHFELSFELETPAYYRLGRNTLYLSPGDKMELFCDLNDPGAGKFIGSGADACAYLRSKPFPKGGSFLAAGSMINDDPSFDEVLKRLDEKVQERLKELEETPNLSDHFRKMEKGRIMFGAANTLFSYTGYASYAKKLSEEETKELDRKANSFFADAVQNYTKNGGDAAFLGIDVYRDICQSCIGILGTENVGQAIIDYTKAKGLLSQLKNHGPTTEIVEKKSKTLDELNSAQYKEVINKAFEKYKALLPGQPAPDLTFKTRTGEDVKLSDFKGKVVVLDVWATWCGPCVQESPFFETMAGKLKDKNVEFIAVSIDSNVKIWEKYLAKHPKTTKQFITNRTRFAPYLIHGIPRFMVFDSEGLIIDAFASRPSDPTLEKIIEKALK